LAVSKDQATVGIGSAGEGVNTVTHLARHGELDPVGPMETLAGHEAVKIVATLEVPSGTEGESGNSSERHRVIVFLVRLDVLAIFDAAMLVVIDGLPGNDGPGTECLGNAEFVRKSIQPENVEENHLNEHACGKTIKRSHVVCAAHAFLGCADAALNVGDMFVFVADVQLGLDVSGNSSARAFEFGITNDEVGFEAALAIDAMDAFQGFDERVFFSVVEDLRGDETDVSGNRHKEWNLIHEHNVDAQSDVVVLLHDALWDVVCHGNKSSPDLLTCRLALDRAKVTSEDGVSIDGILSGNGTIR
jgi:hypothetical protein